MKMTQAEFARMGALAVNRKRSKKQRIALAKKAAAARWKNHEKKEQSL